MVAGTAGLARRDRGSGAHFRLAGVYAPARVPRTALCRSVMRPSLGTIIWLIVGILLASSHGYLTHVDRLRPIVSALLAILLWPLLLLGINLHVK